ncbi:MAG: acyl-CoA thioesterase, partial [Rhodospirillales bacterium]|nr:acyl-CoA thioesterase [Rhodospirillales bacterium]
MHPILRTLKVVLGGWRKPPGGLFTESVVHFRVWPNDLDVNMHMNNGRYLTLMDLGRLDLIIRSGFLKVLMERKWAPVAGSAAIRFKRPLHPFERYTMRS